MMGELAQSLTDSGEALAYRIAATTLEKFAQSILSMTIMSNSEGARIGAEEMRRQIASAALNTADECRQQAQDMDEKQRKG